jgi:hypothetical protein
MRLVVIAVAVLAIAACRDHKSAPLAPTKASADAVAVAAAHAPIASPSVQAKAAASAGGARKIDDENDLIDFEYSYPAAAGAIPALRAWLDADLARRKADLVAQAKEGRADAKANDYPFHAYGYWAEWKVVADLPDWLSLSEDVSVYTGGAHPNHGFDALLWDKRAGVKRDPTDLFVSKPALSRAIRTDFCRQLDRERLKKRDGEKLDMFSDCIDPLESTLILGSSNHRSFDRIGILVAPYAAGPYVEGDYEVTLPVAPAVLAAVKPEFRAAFSLRR